MPRAGRGIAAFLAGLALAGCGGARGPTGHERLTVGPSPSLIDQPVRVTISGLPPHGTATLRTSWRSYLGTVWRSAQRVRAGGDGRATVSGTRALTTMTARGSGLFFPLGLASTARLELDEGGRAVARAALRRWTVAPSVRVRRLSMRRDGIYGVLMLPRVHRRAPAVLALSGSEGGLGGGFAVAAMLASHGYPALALGYFKGPGLPREPARLPLEYFARGLRRLARAPGVNPRRLVVAGGSLGGEASLLIGTTFPRLVHGVIGLVPSAQAGVARGGAPLWTYRGAGIEPDSLIPVERIDGPVLVAGAGEDGRLDSGFYAEQIDQRLVQHHFRFAHRRLDFPRAGHDVGLPIPYLAPATDRLSWGGRAAATVAGRVVLQRAMLDFMRRLR